MQKIKDLIKKQEEEFDKEFGNHIPEKPGFKAFLRQSQKELIETCLKEMVGEKKAIDPYWTEKSDGVIVGYNQRVFEEKAKAEEIIELLKAEHTN